MDLNKRERKVRNLKKAGKRYKEDNEENQEEKFISKKGKVIDSESRQM